MTGNLLVKSAGRSSEDLERFHRSIYRVVIGNEVITDGLTVYREHGTNSKIVRVQ